MGRQLLPRLEQQCIAISLALSLVWTSGGIAEAALGAPLLARPNTSPIQKWTPPERLGKVSDYFAGPKNEAGAPFVVLIQDLHAHYGVQKNIAELLQFLAKKAPLKIAVEGASDPIDASVLALFPDRKIKQAASDYLMRQGELTGAEYYAAMAGLPHALTGVEDPRYYAIHRDLFRKTIAVRGLLVDDLKSIQAEFQTLKKKIYDDDVRSIESQTQAFEQGDVDAEEYLRSLASRARAFGLPLEKGYPQLAQFLNAPRAGHEAKFDLVFHEAAELAFRLQLAHAKKGPEKDLVQVSHDLDLLLQVADLQATELQVRDFAPRLNQFIALAKSLLSENPTAPSFNEKSLRRLISSSIDYYVMALMRNQPMVDNTLALVGQRDVKSQTSNIKNNKTSSSLRFEVPDLRFEVRDQPAVAVLIAGGFHTAPITQILREKNVGYIVITPVLDQITEADHALYIKRLRGQLLTVKDVLADAKTIRGGSGAWSRLAGRLPFNRSKDGLAISGGLAFGALGVAAVYGATGLSWTDFYRLYADYVHLPAITPYVQYLMTTAGIGAIGVMAMADNESQPLRFRQEDDYAMTWEGLRSNKTKLLNLMRQAKREFGLKPRNTSNVGLFAAVIEGIISGEIDDAFRSDFLRSMAEMDLPALYELGVRPSQEAITSVLKGEVARADRRSTSLKANMDSSVVIAAFHPISRERRLGHFLLSPDTAQLNEFLAPPPGQNPDPLFDREWEVLIVTSFPPPFDDESIFKSVKHFLSGRGLFEFYIRTDPALGSEETRKEVFLNDLGAVRITRRQKDGSLRSQIIQLDTDAKPSASGGSPDRSILKIPPNGTVAWVAGFLFTGLLLGSPKLLAQTPMDPSPRNPQTAGVRGSDSNDFSARVLGSTYESLRDSARVAEKRAFPTKPPESRSFTKINLIEIGAIGIAVLGFALVLMARALVLFKAIRSSIKQNQSEAIVPKGSAASTTGLPQKRAPIKPAVTLKALGLLQDPPSGAKERVYTDRILLDLEGSNGAVAKAAQSIVGHAFDVPNPTDVSMTQNIGGGKITDAVIGDVWLGDEAGRAARWHELFRLMNNGGKILYSGDLRADAIKRLISTAAAAEEPSVTLKHRWSGVDGNGVLFEVNPKSTTAALEAEEPSGQAEKKPEGTPLEAAPPPVETGGAPQPPVSEKDREKDRLRDFLQTKFETRAVAQSGPLVAALIISSSFGLNSSLLLALGILTTVLISHVSSPRTPSAETLGESPRSFTSSLISAAVLAGLLLIGFVFRDAPSGSNSSMEEINGKWSAQQEQVAADVLHGTPKYIFKAVPTGRPAAESVPAVENRTSAASTGNTNIVLYVSAVFLALITILAGKKQKASTAGAEADLSVEDAKVTPIVAGERSPAVPVTVPSSVSPSVQTKISVEPPPARSEDAVAVAAAAQNLARQQERESLRTSLREQIAARRNARTTLSTREPDEHDASGGYKGMGPRTAQDELDLMSLGKRNLDFIRTAKDLNINIREKTPFKLISASLPAGMMGYHFLHPKDKLLIIVLNTERPKGFDEEIIFHEIREAYWLAEVAGARTKLPRQRLSLQQQAHLIAAAEQAKKFAKAGQLTPLHEHQLRHMTAEEKRRLLDETPSKRKLHRATLELAVALGAAPELPRLARIYEDGLSHHPILMGDPKTPSGDDKIIKLGGWTGYMTSAAVMGFMSEDLRHTFVLALTGAVGLIVYLNWRYRNSKLENVRLEKMNRDAVKAELAASGLDPAAGYAGTLDDAMPAEAVEKTKLTRRQLFSRYVNASA